MLRLIRLLLSVVFLLVSSLPLLANTTSAEVYQLFPERVGSFARVGLAGPPDALIQESVLSVQSLGFGGQVKGHLPRRLVIRAVLDPVQHVQAQNALGGLVEVKPEIRANGGAFHGYVTSTKASSRDPLVASRGDPR